MRALFPVALLALTTSAFASTITLTCSPSGGDAIINNTTVLFNQGHGTATYTCSDASLGPVTLLGESVNILTDYTMGNGSFTDPVDNSAGFTFSNSATTWAMAHAGAPTTTMSLSSGPGVTIFTVGNKNSSASTFTNTTSGGLGGTSFVPPTTDVVTGALLDSFTINLTAFVDAGGFSNGASDASVSVTYNYEVSPVPEPASLGVVGGLLGIGLLARRRFIAGVQ